MTGSSRRSFFREGSLLKKSLMNLFARQSKEKKLYSRRNEAAYPSEKPRIGKLSLFGLSIRAINSHPSGSYWSGAACSPPIRTIRAGNYSTTTTTFRSATRNYTPTASFVDRATVTDPRWILEGLQFSLLKTLAPVQADPLEQIKAQFPN
jgi:hypothetical protein